MRGWVEEETLCVCYVCEIASCDQYSNLLKLTADLLNSPNSFSSSHSFENIAHELPSQSKASIHNPGP